MKRLNVLASLVVIGLLSLSVARAESADDIYKAVKARIQSAKDYTCSYDYHGPKGEFKFDYRCVRPGDIRTQIKQGANSGAILIYRPESNKDNVKAHKGMFTVNKSTTDEQIANTPIIESVYDMAIRMIGSATPSVKGDETVGGHACSVLTFTGGAELAVDKSTHDILRWKQPEGGAVTERDFYNVQFNVGPKIDF